MEVKVTFYYLNRTIEVLCKSNEEMDKMYGKFVSKLGDDSEVDHYIFYYETHKLGHDSTIEKNKFISGKKDINITAQKKLRIIKCPKCKCNDCIINLNNNIASYYGCKNDHSSSSIYDSYINIQKIDSELIRCNESGCQHNQQNYNLGFYKCLKCSYVVKFSQYFCKEHISSHDKRHIWVKYDKKNYFCEKHFKQFIKYCFTHHKNLCEDCEKDHKTDNIEDYNCMTPNVDKLKESLTEMEENINTLKLVINRIKDSLDDTLRIFKRYHYIAKDIIGKFELFNKELKNNRILKSLWNLQSSNIKMNNELTKIIDEESLLNKANLLLILYENNEAIYKKNMNEIIDFKKEDDEWWKEIKECEKKKLTTSQNKNQNQNQNQNNRKEQRKIKNK